MVSLAATKVDELQLHLKLPGRHLERRVKQIDSLEAKLQAQAEKAWASGQAAAQAECAKMKRRFTRWGSSSTPPKRFLVHWHWARPAAAPWILPRAAASLCTSSGAWSRTTAPVGSCRWGPSEARCAPLVRLLLLSDPGS